MRRCNWGTIYAIFLIVGFAMVGCTSFTYQPSDLDAIDWDKIEAEIKVERVHLPTKCRPFYNDGTEAWINCMGVGYVRAK